jgi:PAS domain S-box-containing protein
MKRLEELSWNELVDELRELAQYKPGPGELHDDPRVVLHNLLVHQVELEMQNRELRDAQERLETSRARYADLYDFAPVGCLTIDDEGRIQEINLTGAALLGRDRADIIGRKFLGVVPPRDKAIEFHDHLRRCMDERSRVDMEIEFAPKGRAPILLHVTSAPMIDAGGKVVACRTALTDVTDRRRAEHAEADSRMKEEFLGTISHELRTPLTAILGWANVLQVREQRDGQIDGGLLRHALEVIARNSLMQNRLIEDILDVSRILAGKLRVDLHPVDMNALVLAAVESVRPGAQAKGIALSVSVASNAIALGDGVRLTQVLTNLLGNALKFTETGSIDVIVTTEADFVRTIVRDTGRGIAGHELPHVFERFKQVDSSTTRTAGGIGLGLAIVDHIVRAHGGHATAASPGLGLGAEFSVRIHRANRAEVGDIMPVQPSRGAESLDGRVVLCVDDDADALEVMAFVLQERGAQVHTAGSAFEALEVFAASTPDVVVSDIGLPAEDGFALMSRIRSLPGDAARVPAIALTAYADASSAQRALEAGFQDFLCKPIVPETFVSAVASVVARLQQV